MHDCICSSCKNLKSVFEDDGSVEGFDCEYGFPSDNCIECEAGECEETCNHYVCDEEEDEMVSVCCSQCGKELRKLAANDDGEPVYCVDCYLKNG